MIVFRPLSFVVHRPRWRELVISLVSLSFLLMSCSGLNPGGFSADATANPAVAPVALAQLRWCGKPVIIFRDEGASSATGATATVTTAETPTLTTGGTPPVPAATATQQPITVTKWSQAQPKLGFSVYLPQMLPQNTCLVSVSGTLHDPIFGGSFTIGYLLADHSSISLAEAPLRSQSRQFQCTPFSSTDNPTPTASSGPAQANLQICSGVQDHTSIVFSARGSTDYLQQFFTALQPDINWVPAS